MEHVVLKRDAAVIGDLRKELAALKEIEAGDALKETCKELRLKVFQLEANCLKLEETLKSEKMAKTLLSQRLKNQEEKCRELERISLTRVRKRSRINSCHCIVFYLGGFLWTAGEARRTAEAQGRLDWWLECGARTTPTISLSRSRRTGEGVDAFEKISCQHGSQFDSEWDQSLFSCYHLYVGRGGFG